MKIRDMVNWAGKLGNGVLDTEIPCTNSRKFKKCKAKLVAKARNLRNTKLLSNIKKKVSDTAFNLSVRLDPGGEENKDENKIC